MIAPFPQSGYTPPEAPDPRNILLEKAQPIAPYPSSYKTDLSALGVYDQQKVPDCVENAVTFVKKYHTYKASGSVIDLCRRFLAILTVQADGFPLSEGTSLLNAFKVAQKKGICESSYLADNHALDINTFASPAFIQLNAYNNAQYHTINGYAFLSDLSEQGLKNAIYQNGVVILGVKLDKSWWTAKNGEVSWDSADILPLRIPIDKASESGHAIVCYAYDENYFYVHNSFGVEWGDQGHGWFGKEYLSYIYEAATVLDIDPAKVEELKKVATIVADTAEIVNSNPTALQLTFVQSILKWVAEFLASFKINQ